MLALCMDLTEVITYLGRIDHTAGNLPHESLDGAVLKRVNSVAPGLGGSSTEYR